MTKMGNAAGTPILSACGPQKPPGAVAAEADSAAGCSSGVGGGGATMASSGQLAILTAIPGFFACTQLHAGFGMPASTGGITSHRRQLLRLSINRLVRCAGEHLEGVLLIRLCF